ncbi:MAG: 30S ribosomal protein S12 methylthiotransferase RimO [Thermodesulfobacteriota bacterium]|nr:30S ribosomal protein S12 methylthiotransferase RimO [Thermodesulfobacteriota bacterium]
MNKKNEKTVHLVSLGCPKNLVDSEYILGLLAECGYEITEEPGQAGVVIVNTCAFIRSAVEESIETILELARLKKNGLFQTLVVVGCLPQRYKDDLAASLPEVDLFLGTGELAALPDLLEAPAQSRAPGRGFWSRPGFVPAGPGPRLRSAPFFSAYLKIAEGCSNACSYCLIPSLRGPLRSRPLAVLVEEAAILAESGVKELILIAQDTTAYGQDLASGIGLARLLTELAEIQGLKWLRIMYAYPAGITENLIQVMAGLPKVCPYLDLPLQHAGPAVLARMRRSGPADLLGLILRLRRDIPGLTLRTTMMTGFPGETSRDFEILMDFVSQARFDRLGVFAFSPEEGTPAAKASGQIAGQVKEDRRIRLMARQRRISREINEAMIGRTIPVLTEGFSPETDLLLAGRSQGQAPDIDGLVYINEGTASPGEIKPVFITEAHDYDLVGRIVDED